MAFLSLIWMLLFVFLAVTESQKTCTDINMYSNLIHGKYLAGSEFQTHSNTTLLLCVKECQLRKRCASFNSEVGIGTCVLNEGVETNSSLNFTESPDSVYSDISGWPERLAGACASHSCPENAYCRETDTEQYECVVESCVDPPRVGNAQIMTSSRFTEFGAVVPYQCNLPKIPVGEITCLQNGSWEGHFACNRLQNCKDIKTCNRSYGDGEYWLYMRRSDYRLVKVYCHNMEGNPKSFVTLTGHTYSDFLNQSLTSGCNVTWPAEYCGKTVFAKVRLYPWHKQIYMDNYVFANSDCGYSPLGWAGDCRLCPEGPVHGSFKIDLSGTGLKVASSVTWISNSSSQDPIWKRTNNGTIITGVCVGGCDYCKPTGIGVTEMDLPVELDPSYDLDLSQATFPTCSVLHSTKLS